MATLRTDKKIRESLSRLLETVGFKKLDYERHIRDFTKLFFSLKVIIKSINYGAKSQIFKFFFENFQNLKFFGKF